MAEEHGATGSILADAKIVAAWDPARPADQESAVARLYGSLIPQIRTVVASAAVKWYAMATRLPEDLVRGGKVDWREVLTFSDVLFNVLCEWRVPQAPFHGRTGFGLFVDYAARWGAETLSDAASIGFLVGYQVPCSFARLPTMWRLVAMLPSTPRKGGRLRFDSIGDRADETFLAPREFRIHIRELAVRLIEEVHTWLSIEQRVFLRLVSGSPASGRYYKKDSLMQLIESGNIDEEAVVKCINVRMLAADCGLSDYRTKQVLITVFRSLRKFADDADIEDAELSELLTYLGWSV